MLMHMRQLKIASSPEMSSPTIPTTDLPPLLSRLKKIFEEETSENILSPRDVKDAKTMIERFVNQLNSIRDDLHQTNKSRHQDSEKDDWNFPGIKLDLADEDQLVKRLRMSYEIFISPSELNRRDPRICLFLSIFPQNAVLKKRLLIYWWIGEGLVFNEKEGEEVFDELLDLEILIPHRTHDDKCPIVSKCQVHPWMRKMLTIEAMKEKLLNIEEGIPRFDPTYSRRACLMDHIDLAKSESRDSELDKWRTIFNVNVTNIHFPPQWLAKLNRLRVLQLGRWRDSPTHHIEVRDESFLIGLKSQKYLKYLSLRGISRITTLPESIRELVNLQILDLKACHNLETLPKAIASLKKLTHLDVSECYLLDSMPKGIDRLTSLQVLKGFIIGNSKKNPIRIRHLTSLTNLKRLSIHIGSDATIQKEELKKLEDLTKVEFLKIFWGKAVEESLSLPTGLKVLHLEGIPHKNMPQWLQPGKLRNLETLYIKGGKLCNSFDHEGEQWKNVKYLVLKYTEMPEINQETLRAMFPSLQYVKKVKRDENGKQEIVEYEWSKM